MSVSVAVSSMARADGAASFGAADLAEILSRFNAASEALQATHERLQGEVVRLQGELRDANEQLQRSRRLAALGEMAAGIAHEVRNPLASIALDAKMLERDAGERADARSAAERIGTAVRRLNEVVGDVLGFAREVSPRVEAVEASDLFERVEQECGPLACAAGVRLVLGAGGRVWCDPDLGHRAVANVVRNAIEAIAERGVGRGVDAGGGEVEMSAGRSTRDGRAVGVVRVGDNGPGIDGAALDRMFNPFFTTRAAGTGLGLAIVHRIMDAHAGRVLASNNVDGSGGVAGATFELHFPEPSARRRARVTPMETDR